MIEEIDWSVGQVLDALRPTLGDGRRRADTRTLRLPEDPGPGWRP